MVCRRWTARRSVDTASERGFGTACQEEVTILRRGAVLVGLTKTLDSILHDACTRVADRHPLQGGRASTRVTVVVAPALDRDGLPGAAGRARLTRAGTTAAELRSCAELPARTGDGATCRRTGVLLLPADDGIVIAAILQRRRVLLRARGTAVRYGDAYATCW